VSTCLITGVNDSSQLRCTGMADVEMMREDERPDFLDYLPSEREDSTSECAFRWTGSNLISRNVDRQLSRSIGITLSLCLSPRLKYTMRRSAFLIFPRASTDKLDI